MFSLLIIIHAASVLIAMGAGAKLVREIMTRSVSYTSFVHFLRYTLISDIIGLLFAGDGHLLSVRLLSMVSVFISGIVVLSWKFLRWKDIRRAIFASNLSILFGIHVQIAFYLILKHVFPSAWLGIPPKANTLISLIENIVALSYFVLALFATIRFRTREI